MKASAYLLLLASLGTASWFAWQEYGFLFAEIDAVDVSDMSLAEDEPTTHAPINLDFLSASESPGAKPIDLDFLQAEPNKTESAESLIADFMGVDSIDSIKVDGIAANPICIFDPIGQGGDIYELVKGFKSLALDRGVNLNIKTFDNENVIVDSFKAGRCDAIAVTGMHARPFNKFTASIEAVGALPHYSDLQSVLQYLAHADAAPRAGQQRGHRSLSFGPADLPAHHSPG